MTATAGDRYVVAGLARARAPWFRAVATWANSGAAPIDFVPCLGAEELRLAVTGHRAFSAALLDGGLPSVDRDLVQALAAAGVTPIVVGQVDGGTDWAALGAAAVLPTEMSRTALLDTLRTRAEPVTAVGMPEPPAVPDGTSPDTRGVVVAVCGAGGAGSSTVAMALAQGFARGDERSGRRSFADRLWAGVRRVRPGPTAGADGPVPGTPASGGAKDGVVLADLCLEADQAVLHDARDVVPGVQELVEAHRLRELDPGSIRSHTFFVEERGYHLLLGLRRAANWTAVRPRAFAAALAGLRTAFTTVVADIDVHLETEETTGSIDVEERATMCQTALAAATVVVVVGRPGVSGAHSLVRRLQGLVDHGVEPGRLLPVCTAMGRGVPARARYTRAVAELVDLPQGASLSGVVYLPRRPVDEAVHDAGPLPAAVVDPVVRAVRVLAAQMGATAAGDADPVPVRPGSLGLAHS